MMFFNIMIALSIVVSSLLTSWILIKIIGRAYGVDVEARLFRRRWGRRRGRYSENIRTGTDTMVREKCDKGNTSTYSIKTKDEEFEELKKRIEELGL